MDSRIYQSTLSNRKFASFYFINDSNSWKRRWGQFITVLLTSFLLPGLISSYGIVASIRRETHHPVSELLITPLTFYSLWMLTESFFYDAADNLQRASFKLISSIGLLLSFFGVMCNAWFDATYYHIIFYGVLGGLGTSMVLSQVNYIIDDNICQASAKKLGLLTFYGHALGQCILPWIYMVIFHFYGHLMGYLLLSGIVLQILPITLCFKSDTFNHKKVSDPHIATYKRAYSLFGDDSSSNGSGLDLPLTELSKKSWKSPSDENLYMYNGEHSNSSSVDNDDVLEFDWEIKDHDKIKTFQGVEILPKILEESEEIDTEEEKYFRTKEVDNELRIEKSIKRLSALSNVFDDIIEQDVSHIQKESTDLSNRSSSSETEKNVSTKCVRNIKGEERLLGQKWFNRPFPSNTRGTKNMLCYKIYLNLKKFPGCFMERIIRPLIFSLKTWQLYPVIFLKISYSLLLSIFSSLIAIVDYSKEPLENSNTLSLSNITLIISMHGISWLCFLIFSPCIVNLKKSKFKIVSSFGCIISSLGLLVILEFRKIELIALGASLTGIGYGAISISYQDTSRDFIGLRKWITIKKTLESLTAVFIFGIGLCLSYLLTLNKGVEYCFETLSSLLFLSGLIWLIITFIETVNKYKQNDTFWPQV